MSSKKKNVKNISENRASEVKHRNNSSKSNDSKNNALKTLEDIMNYYYLTDENINIQMIIHKIMENLEVYLKTIQQIIQPEEFHSLYECASFDEDDKEKLFEMYKNLILLHRKLLKALILNDEKNSILVVRYVHEESLKFKNPMALVIDKLQDSWTINTNDKKSKSAHYFG